MCSGTIYKKSQNVKRNLFPVKIHGCVYKDGILKLPMIHKVTF